MRHAPLDRSNFINVANFERRVAALAQVCQGRAHSQKGGCLRAQLNMKYLRACSSRASGGGAWQAATCQKTLGANKSREWRKAGGGRGWLRSGAGGSETRLRRV